MVKKIIKAFIPYGLIVLYRKLRRNSDRNVQQSPNFGDQIPVLKIDDKTKEENPLEEFNEVRKLLTMQHKKAYPQEFIRIGDFTYGEPIIRIWNDKISVKIGKFCSIAANVQIMLGGEHSIDWITTYPFSAFLHYYKNMIGNFTRAGDDIIIGNDVWIGGDAKIMSGVVIGNGCVIGANAVVTRNRKLSDYTIWGGVPAKQIGKRFSDKIIEKLQNIQWWDWADGDICKVIPILQNNDVEKLIAYYEEYICSKNILTKNLGVYNKLNYGVIPT